MTLTPPPAFLCQTTNAHTQITVGCTDGANDYVELLLDWAYEYGLTVLFDVHGMKGSQNGFDNSGQSMGFEWTSKINLYPRGLTTFQHWPIRSAGWMGDFNRTSLKINEINRENIKHSLEVLEEIVKLYGGHPAVLGLQPVNEPWEYTPIDELKVRERGRHGRASPKGIFFVDNFCGVYMEWFALLKRFDEYHMSKFWMQITNYVFPEKEIWRPTL